MKGFIEVTEITGANVYGEPIFEKILINIIDIRNIKLVSGVLRLKLTYENSYTWIQESYEEIKELIKQAL